MTVGPVVVERTSPSPQVIPQIHDAPLVIEIDLKVSSLEKMLAGNLTTQARATAARLATQAQAQNIARMPKLLSVVPTAISQSDISQGVKVKLTWSAQYDSPLSGYALQSTAQRALLAIAKADPTIGSRVITLVAYRPA